MKKIHSLALAGWFVLSVAIAPATTITENFSASPQQNGWKIFGDTNLFHWNSANQNLEVTWDSSHANSYFYFPLGTILARDDDFTFAFDLRLADAHTGNTDGPLQLGIGFLNRTNATNPNFSRGIGNSPNVVEFAYYPEGDFPNYHSPATVQPAFVDQTSSAFAPYNLVPYQFALPTNLWLHIVMGFTASNQTAVIEISTNGVSLVQFPPLILNDYPANSGFSDTNDYRATMFSINNYSEAGQFPPYVGTILAHGVVDNVLVTIPPPPVQNLAGTFTNNWWQTTFLSRSNWLYTLERTADLQSWTDASPTLPGNATNLFLPDTNPPTAQAFYRVRAERP